MTLDAWLKENFPGRGGPAWLVREAKTSAQTIQKAREGEPIGKRDTAVRISAATGGVVTVAELMQLDKRGRAA